MIYIYTVLFSTSRLFSFLGFKWFGFGALTAISLCLPRFRIAEMTSLHANQALKCFCIAIAVSIFLNCCHGFKPRLLSTRQASGFCLSARTSLTSAGDKVVRSENHPEAIVFAGVKFGGPIAKSLRKLGITDPSPIQKASIAPLTTGLTCILHVSYYLHTAQLT